jgi:hypothetical protein
MPIPTYTPGYPPDGSSLGQTKATIRNNLDGTFQTLAVDHINNNGQPGSQPAGYHNIIHQVTQTNVSTVTGVNQIFSGVPGTLIVNGVTTPAVPAGGDTQLYSLTGNGGLTQLTGSNVSATGYTWAGGILIQWGFVNSIASSFQTQNFPVPFPHVCLGVFTQIYGNNTLPGGEGTIDIKKSAVSGSSFQWAMITNSSQYIGFYWWAIGN